MMQLVGQNDAVPMNIGIRGPIVVPGQHVPPAEPVRLILAGGAIGKSYPPENGEVQSGPVEQDIAEKAAPRVIFPEVPEEKQVVDAFGEAATTMTWPHFVERRRFSCKPRVINRELFAKLCDEEGYDASDAGWMSAFIRQEQGDDVLQATTEFVGECGELAELIGGLGIKALWGEPRKKLIDECGDILFTGAWLIEAWATNPHPIPETDEDAVPSLALILDERPFPNPLLAATDTELYRFEGEDIHANIAITIINNGAMKIMKNRQFVGMASQTLMTDLLQLMTFSALTANAAKKLYYQHREQDAKLQVDRVLGAFYAVNFILCLANSSVEEAMIVNRRKIDARYPNGYFEGVNGGIRNEG